MEISQIIADIQYGVSIFRDTENIEFLWKSLSSAGKKLRIANKKENLVQLTAKDLTEYESLLKAYSKGIKAIQCHRRPQIGP